MNFIIKMTYECEYGVIDGVWWVGGSEMRSDRERDIRKGKESIDDEMD